VLVEAEHELADELLGLGKPLERDFHRLFGVGALAEFRACEVAPLRRVLAEVLEQLQPATGVFLGVLEGPYQRLQRAQLCLRLPKLLQDRA